MPIILICLMLVYAGLSGFVWMRHKKHRDQAYPIHAELMVLGVALLVHGAALLMPVLKDQVLITGFGYSISLIVWLMLMMYCLGSFFYCLRGLQLLLYPCAALSLLLGMIFPANSSAMKSAISPLCCMWVRHYWHTAYSGLSCYSQY